MHTFPKTYRCNSCKKPIDEEEATYLHEKLNDLKPGFYYCEACLNKGIFTLYWLTGKREVIKGSTIKEAFSSAGIGTGALFALDFYAEGDDKEYVYNEKEHTWNKKRWT